MQNWEEEKGKRKTLLKFVVKLNDHELVRRKIAKIQIMIAGLL